MQSPSPLKALPGGRWRSAMSHDLSPVKYPRHEAHEAHAGHGVQGAHGEHEAHEACEPQTGHGAQGVQEAHVPGHVCAVISGPIGTRRGVDMVAAPSALPASKRGVGQTNPGRVAGLAEQARVSGSFAAAGSAAQGQAQPRVSLRRLQPAASSQQLTQPAARSLGVGAVGVKQEGGSGRAIWGFSVSQAQAMRALLAAGLRDYALTGLIPPPLMRAGRNNY